MTTLTSAQTEMFYPGLFTEEEMAPFAKGSLAFRRLVTETRNRSLASGTPLYITGGYLNRQVHLTTLSGSAAFMITENGLEETREVRNWHLGLKDRGRDRKVITSKNNTYLLSALSVETISKVINVAIEQEYKDVHALVAAASSRIAKESDRRNKMETYYTNPQAYHALLRTLFDDGFNALQISDMHRSKLFDDYTDLSKKIRAESTFTERLGTMLDGEKWFIRTTKFGSGVHIPKVLAIGTGQVTCDVGTYGVPVKVQPTTPMRLYRSMEDFYKTYPQHESGMRSALGFCKTYRETLDATQKLTHDGFYDGLLPLYDCVYEDIGGGNYLVGEHFGQVQWTMLMLSKG